MAHEALKGPTPREPFETILSQREGNPDLFVTLQDAAYFSPKNPRFIDSVTVDIQPRLHSFLEEKGVCIEPLTTGGIPKQELLDKLNELGVKITPYARDIVNNSAFRISTDAKQIQVVAPRVDDLGTAKKFPTTAERDARSAEINLGRLSGEEFLHYVLSYGGNLKPGEVIFASMEPITDSDGDPSVLYVERHGDAVWLYVSWVEPSNEWLPDDRVAFSLR